MDRAPDIKTSLCVPEFASVDPAKQAGARREATGQTAKAMPGIAKRNGKLNNNLKAHRSPLPPPETRILAHFRTSTRNLTPPEACSVAPAQQHPEQQHQHTWAPVSTPTLLSAEQPPARNNGETELENTEQGAADVASGQEWVPTQTIYSDGLLQTQTITGQVPETVEDATDLFEAKLEILFKAVKAYRYNPMASLHRPVTDHVHASRSRTGPTFADQRLARSNPRPLETGPIRARHQYTLEPSSESLHIDECSTDQLAGSPSREGRSPTEQQIPIQKVNVRKERASPSPSRLNIQEAMGLNADAASRRMYARIVDSARELSMQAQIDFSQSFSKQEDDRVAEFCRTMRNRHDILWKYENDWATKAILQQCLSDSRNHMKRKEASLVVRGTATAIAADRENAVPHAEDNSCSHDDSEKNDPCPLGTPAIQARHQNMPGPSRESLQCDDIRPLDRTEQPVDTPSKRSADLTEQQIPRPMLCVTKNGQILKKAMGLDVDWASRAMYREILHSTRELAMQAQIDFSQVFVLQQGERVAEFCRIMRDRHAVLRKYENDWATKVILQRYMTTHRHYLKIRKEASLLGRGKATATVTGTDKGEDAVNEKSASFDDAGEKDGEEQSADTEYETWLGFGEGCDTEI
ncbi:hypothetical protein FA95DRAFT_1610408 [Auriscalpium vulgare]|uniref:Uncharacterized protein n=1 Tax=Auriscalpium vulgare TaxID=40419 RepID=A0ACB8REQ6_9AGAM|nr:hypothetical protein FA95DRAFT_1610408 [Auriscalpium vulgare]